MGDAAEPTSILSVNGIVTDQEYDVVIIGAGLSGVYMLYRVRELGLRVKVLEAGTGVGGTWYWNRYPGARFDSESYTYQFSFSQELLDEWDWTEHFAPQPETEKYVNRFVDKFDLRKDVQFSSRVKAAKWLDDERKWDVWLREEDGGTRFRCRFLFTAIGPLSAPTLPRFPGLASFKGPSCHTARWPKAGMEYADKRVAVVGTGATGVQTIQEVAKTAKTLHVFQRRPNWCAPLKNGPISKGEMDKIRKGYPAMFKRCLETFACFVHQADPRSALEVTSEEREAFWNQLYDSPGFGIWMGNFKDILVNEEANALLTDFVARKIRERVHNPELAEKLIPKDHGFGTRRVPLETKYYEVYNQDNVFLVDLNTSPIERITENGIMTRTGEYEFDVIVYATGFNPVTGSFDEIDIRGKNNLPLQERWKNGPETYLGLINEGFPNMLMLLGPHAILGNVPRTIEYAVDWLAALMRYAQENNITYIEPTKEECDKWTDHVKWLAENLLGSNVDSWMTGVNTNVEGKRQRTVSRYAGSAPAYRQRCDQIAADRYQEMILKS